MNKKDIFMSKVIPIPEAGCWIWSDYIDDIGYGRNHPKTFLGENKAHRTSWQLFVGDIPSGMKVLHKCDVRCCVNPNHLFIGSQKDNVHDMWSKGRQHKRKDIRAHRNPMAVLSWSTVNQIRFLNSIGMKQYKIAERLGVSKMTISRVIRGETWNERL